MTEIKQAIKQTIKIDFISDIACPWCAIGLGSLSMAKGWMSHRAQFEVHFRAFAGLDPIRASQVLAGNEYAEEVRQEEQRYRGLGIHSVPSMIINDQYLVQGAQPPTVFLDIFEKLIEQAV